MEINWRELYYYWTVGMKQPSIDFWKSTPRIIFMLFEEDRKHNLIGTEQEEVYADDVN